ncbi:MAG: leucine-rich repeat domain-containing protein, partial [Clostridiales bacterium]|nr:leucine-rich repeat domain-containing protein [Clostridiales bacterium]
MSKYFKRIFAVLVTFTLTLSLLPSLKVNAADEVASGTCGANLTWSLDSEGTLTISGTGEMYELSLVTDVPWYENRFSINDVIIEEGATSIGCMFFYNCVNLNAITIPDSV